MNLECNAVDVQRSFSQELWLMLELCQEIGFWVSKEVDAENRLLLRIICL